MTKSVHLGFEVGTGKPVTIPLRHMVVTGQTQEAGKTTTLEALIERAVVKAIAFVTKRGEGSFGDAPIVAPYFKEQADWKYVAAILEASRGEKLKFERAWIIRASKGAKSLADVQANIRRELANPKTRGMSADVYLTLDAYLEDVVPQVESVQWAKRVVLAPGLNVMDLTAISEEMQHLVLRSTIEWVLKNESDTIVVIPEAWKFIPQGRGTPVKLAAEAYIRQAAALRNYLWLDSQDIAGVEKIILKSVAVWILGVQREANEVKRTLGAMPAATPKLTAAQIATLGLGEFYVCLGTDARKVYVQPRWLSEKDAIAVACGMPVPVSPEQPKGEPTVKESEARELRRANEALEKDLNQTRARLTEAYERLDEMEKRLDNAPSSNAKVPESAPASGRPASGDTGSTPVGAIDEDALYQRFKQRLAKEAPAILRVLTIRPELEVSVERKTLTMDGSSLKGRLARLIARGFFREPKTQGATRTELKRSGPDMNSGTLSKAFSDFVSDGFLTSEGDGYLEVTGMKVNIVEA